MPDPNPPQSQPAAPPDRSVYGGEWGGSGKGAGSAPPAADRPQKIHTPHESEGEGETESPRAT